MEPKAHVRKAMPIVGRCTTLSHMRVQAAILADHAEVLGGKLYVMGGAFDTIYGRVVPVVHKKLHVVLILEIDVGDRLRDLRIDIELVDEDGRRVGPHAEGRLRVGAPASLKPGQPSVIPLQIPFENLQFPAAMLYAFRVTSGGEEIAKIPVGVQLRDAQA